MCCHLRHGKGPPSAITFVRSHLENKKNTKFVSKVNENILIPASFGVVMNRAKKRKGAKKRDDEAETAFLSSAVYTSLSYINYTGSLEHSNLNAL